MAAAAPSEQVQPSVMSAPDVRSPADRPRAFRPRFTLRTLLLAVLLIGSTTTLWWHWEPWVMRAHFGKVGIGYNHIAVSGDGKRLLASNGAGTAEMFDAQSGTRLAEVPNCMCSIPAISRDGEWAATCSEDDKLSLFDASGAEISSAPGVTVGCRLTFFPDGRRIMADNGQRGIAIFEYPKLKLLVELEATRARDSPPDGQSQSAGPSKYVACGCPIISSDGTQIFGFDFDGSALRTWNVETGKLLALPKAALNLTGGVYAQSMSRDGTKLLIYGPRDNNQQSPNVMRLWDIASGESGIIKDRNGEDIDLAWFFPDGQILAVGPQTFSVWQTQPLQQLAEFKYETTPTPQSYVAGGLSANGNAFVYYTDGSRACILDRRRPESPYGVIILPELWLTILLVPALLWSLGRDWRLLRSKLS
jgi:WD40 repeat protein